MKYILDYFLKYVAVNTKSDPLSPRTPSTEGQIELARMVKRDMEVIGFDDIFFDERRGYLYGKIAANTKSPGLSIGFIAHLDTSFEESAINVKPKVITYTGGSIVINNERGMIIDPSENPDLEGKKGKTVIHASGDTLLGADDKAGLAEIISACRYIREHNEIEHGDVYVAFTPDEEIGKGTAYFNLEYFKPDFAFTVDGSEAPYYEDENFNAVNGYAEFIGFNTHPGSAYRKMINSVRASSLFISEVEDAFSPECTKDREGFIHFDKVEGDVNRTRVDFIIRDFESGGIERFKKVLESCKGKVQARFPKVRTELVFKESYRNMKEIISRKPLIEEVVRRAYGMSSLELKKNPIRGGTDGARLSFMGLAAPNLFTGGYNFHSKYEFAVLEEMETAAALIVNIIRESKD